ncbi:hypothetical protein FRC14_008198 [Serendipita sp. 396]|nr:hypothetical protein FRC14_008198 [Serendipita sp. 396]KAG8786319.1 hypothetical protein FRC15_011636 [Serendipita sp. 397]KAG8817674.1 hypothetical protein FRC19_011209 [Serendipita sp. 401]KAG8820706.1 hypothetical protein FRC18_011626 [Serendipita sp. 400]KAG8870335.1 hypothetical protein FRC20_011984 [Serendipita sp. 405]
MSTPQPVLPLSVARLAQSAPPRPLAPNENDIGLKLVSRANILITLVDPRFPCQDPPTPTRSLTFEKILRMQHHIRA